jgi:hypothetical protein
MEISRVELLGEGEEGSRSGLEVADLEDGLGVWELVLGQIGIQTGLSKQQARQSSTLRT